MAVVKPQIIQVVGFQNSGKTTLVSGLIKEWTSQGKKIVTIKHHGHGGKPETVGEKDSSRHIEAGAAATIVEGSGCLILQSTQKENWGLNEQIEMLSFFHPDTIIIEGHKYAPFQKVVMLRTEEDVKLLNELENIQAIVYWDENLVRTIKDYKKCQIFSIKDEHFIEKLTCFLDQVHKKDEKN